MSWTLPLALVLGWAPTASPAEPPTPPPNEALAASSWAEAHAAEVVEFVLPNGLTVVLSEAHDRSQVFGAIVVRTGSRDDPADHTGMAHYLEHMLFKGTQRLGTVDYGAEEPKLAQLEALFEQLREAPPSEHEAIRARIDEAGREAAKYAIPNELDRLLGEMGGVEVNAFTHPDMTVYYNAFPGSQIDAWIDVSAERFVKPVFRLFPSELEAVYEEKNRAMDGFFMPAYEAFTKAFFPRHTYGTRSVLGEVEHLKFPSLARMRRFFEEHYVAGNMALVLVGDFDAAALRPKIERAFARLPSGPPPERNHGTVEPFRGVEKATVRVTPLRVGAVAFRTPIMAHPNYGATKVLLTMISNPQRTGVLDRLVDGGKLLMAMQFELDFHEHNGAILAYAPRILTQSFAEAEGHVVRALETLGERPPDTEVAAARDHVLYQLERRWEDHEQRALLLADLTARGLHWEDYLRYVQSVERVSAEDVRTVARSHFGEQRLEVRSRMGKPERVYLRQPEATPVRPKEGRHSAYYREYANAPHPPPTPRFVAAEDVETRDGPSGRVLRRNVNPFNTIERIELRFGIGDHDMPELALLAEYLERVGSTKAPGDAFADRMFALSTTLEARTTPEAFVLRLEGPAANLAEALELVADLARAPARDRRRLRRLRLENWATERALRSQADVLANALWEYVVYGYHSKYRRMGARAQRRWSVSDLERAWQEVQTYPMEIRYVGQRTADDVQAEVERTFGWLTPSRPSVAPRIRPKLRPKATRVVFVPRRGSVQTQIRLYVAGDPVPREDLPRMHAWDEYFGGGMAGLVFQEVREYRALAYAARGGYAEPLHAHHRGHTYVELGCQADKTEEALDVAMGLVTEMPAKADRVPGIQRALGHRQETSDPFFRDLQEQLEAWRRRGHDEDPRARWIAAYDDLTYDTIASFWREQVEGRPVVVMVVGDPRKIDRAMLERFGPVETVRTDRLYRPAP